MDLCREKRIRLVLQRDVEEIFAGSDDQDNLFRLRRDPADDTYGLQYLLHGNLRAVEPYADYNELMNLEEGRTPMCFYESEDPSCLWRFKEVGKE
jgi:hypothetical protein